MLAAGKLAEARTAMLGPAEADLRAAQSSKASAETIAAAQARVDAIEKDIAMFTKAGSVSAVTGGLICK